MKRNSQKKPHWTQTPEGRARMRRIQAIRFRAERAAPVEKTPTQDPELAALSRVLDEVRRHLPALSPAGKILLRERLAAEERAEAKAHG